MQATASVEGGLPVFLVFAPCSIHKKFTHHIHTACKLGSSICDLNGNAHVKTKFCEVVNGCVLFRLQRMEKERLKEASGDNLDKEEKKKKKK